MKGIAIIYFRFRTGIAIIFGPLFIKIAFIFGHHHKNYCYHNSSAALKSKNIRCRNNICAVALFIIFSLVSFFYATKEAGYQFGVGCADSSIYLYELFRHIFSKRFIFSVARRGLLSTSNYLLGLANQIPVLDESDDHFEGSGEELPNVIL